MLLSKKVFARTALIMVGVLFLSVAFGQAPLLSQDQVALQIISQRFGIPIDELVIAHHTTLEEEGITRFKVLHVSRIQIYVVNLDMQNREINDFAMEQILAARRSRGFVGKQEQALYDAARIGDPKEPIKVGIWLKQRPNPPRLDRDAPPSARQAQLEVIKNYHAYHADLRRPVEELITRNHGQVLYGSQLAPLVFVEVSKSFLLGATQTASLELRSDVETLYLSREYKPALSSSARAINADNFWNTGINGGGIKIAVVERDGIAYAHSYLRDGTYCNPSNVIIDDHPTKVAGVIGSFHTIHTGIAFGAPAILSGNWLRPNLPVKVEMA